MKLEIKTLPKEFDYLAPDSSEIRLLTSEKRGGLCHCTLPVGKTSCAVKHKTVDEIWYFLSGTGEVWRKYEGKEETDEIQPGTSINIPAGTCFQFRNIGAEPLKFICITMPPWPGLEEAEQVQGKWS